MSEAERIIRARERRERRIRWILESQGRFSDFSRRTLERKSDAEIDAIFNELMCR